MALAAERPTDGGHDDPDAGRRKAEELGQLVPNAVGRLGPGPGSDPVGSGIDDADVGLERQVADRRCLVDPLDDLVGGREPGDDVALAEPERAADVRPGRTRGDAVGARRSLELVDETVSAARAVSRSRTGGSGS
jgi:hypothetical protein